MTDCIWLVAVVTYGSARCSYANQRQKAAFPGPEYVDACTLAEGNFRRVQRVSAELKHVNSHRE